MSANLTDRNSYSVLSIKTVRTMIMYSVKRSQAASNCDAESTLYPPSKKHCPYDQLSKYEAKTNSGYYQASSILKHNSPNEYRAQMRFSGYTRFNHLTMESTDVFCCMVLPFSVVIASSAMELEPSQRDFDFKQFVNIVECITEISRFLYQQTGFLHNITSFPHAGVARLNIELCLLKYFVPSLFTYIDAKGISSVEALLPYIGTIITKVSPLPYFVNALELTRPCLYVNYHISFDILEVTEQDILKANSKIDLQLIHIVYNQLVQQTSNEFSVFF